LNLPDAVCFDRGNPVLTGAAQWRIDLVRGLEIGNFAHRVKTMSGPLAAVTSGGTGARDIGGGRRQSLNGVLAWNFIGLTPWHTRLDGRAGQVAICTAGGLADRALTPNHKNGLSRSSGRRARRKSLHQP